jgi:hypothetical protein
MLSLQKMFLELLNDYISGELYRYTLPTNQEFLPKLPWPPHASHSLVEPVPLHFDVLLPLAQFTLNSQLKIHLFRLFISQHDLVPFFSLF